MSIQIADPGQADSPEPIRSLTARVQGAIERMIVGGELKSGERINEKLLSSRFGVSRGPIREACRALTQAGLLTAVPNRGMFVREIALKEALELYDVRAALDDLAGRTLATRITGAQLETLERLVAEMDGAAAQRDLDRYYPLNFRFHDQLLRLAGNQRLILLYGTLVKELHVFRRRSLLEQGSMRVSNEEHRRVVAALVQGDPVRAGGFMRSHVLAAKQRLIGAIEAEVADAAAPVPVD
jgi:DNA-binding GntR family transcriptional regulator